MAANTLSENITLAIKNADGSSFYNLSLKKFTIDSQVMSLGDKITGDVYYKDNNLPFTMREYVEYDGVKYTLVNPPTVVKEGMVRDNSENKGMTKYSLEFYHPMYQLGNMPFNDVAVSYNESSYMSESATFSWVGYPDDYIAKLNKNLQGTQWIVVKSSNFPSAVESQISEVLAFDKESIADALKKMYETWELPYMVDKVGSSESSYAQGKRFKVIVGMPSAEIYEQGSQDPFVFQYGQGVGLKNNSRSPRNNKIITRIAGYGSERNIPYGYPQIVWTGSTSDSRLQYPLYDGIVGGQPVKLIKHPFTRKTLMPSIYVETVNRKVNPNASGYNPNTEIIEYYDATAAENYPNPINPLAPSYETHEFEDIYPRLGSASIVGVVPSDKDAKTYVPFDQIDDVINKYIDNSHSRVEEEFLEECKDIVVMAGMKEINVDRNYGGHSFIFTLTHDDTYTFMYLEYKSDDLQNFKFTALCEGATPPVPDWDDTMDDKGEYTQSYMEITLPILGFDIYACASITEQMQINMRSGACIGCTFDVAVDWDDYKKNFFNADGDFVPDGAQRDLVKYPKSNVQSITVTAKKDLETFGTLMPNRYQQPQAGDEFVILGISLPLSYIQSAEAELADAAKAYMRENNIYYFDYPLKFDEFFLRNNDHILSQIKPNAIVHFNYAGDTKDLYIKQLTTKVGYAPLPQFDITLTDNIEVSLNQIGQTVDELGKLSDVVALLRRQTSDGLLAAVMSKLSKTDDDTANGLIRFMKGLQIGRSFSSGILGSGGIIGVDADGKTYLEVDEIYARIKAVFDNVEVKNYQHSVGNRMVTKAGIKCSRVEWVDENGEYVEQNQANLSSVVSFRCFYRAKDTDDTVNNDFVAGVNEEDGKGTQDLAFCDSTSIASGVNKRSYWRAVVGKNANGTFTLDGEGWIDLSKADCRANSDIPMAGDDIIQLGNVTDKDRQGAIVEYIGGNDAPCYKIYQEIGLDERTDEEKEQGVVFNPYVLTDKCFIDFGYSRTTKHAYMNVYGDAYIGDKDERTFIKYEQEHHEWITPEPTEEDTEPEPYEVVYPKLSVKAHIEFTNPDSELDEFVQGHQITYGSEIAALVSKTEDLQEQIDGAIETYYMEGAPSLQVPPVVSTEEHPYDDPWLDGTETPEERTKILNNHVGDLYYDKSTRHGYRFLYDDEHSTFAWVVLTDEDVTEALRLASEAQETADGKSTIFLNNPEDQDTTKRYPTNYKKGDSWILPSGSGEVNISNTGTQRKFKKGSILTTDYDMSSAYNPLDWSEKTRYTDDTYAHRFDYLYTALNAMQGSTLISGGLVLSNLIALRDTASTPNIQAGINGVVDQQKSGLGIASWYGGDMGDVEHKNEYPAISSMGDNARWAKSLFRFDGSGYLADGNITWNNQGQITIKNITTLSDSQNTNILNELATFNSAFSFGTSGEGSTTALYITPNVPFESLYIGTSNNNKKQVATQEWVGQHFITTSFFDELFQLYNNTTKISPNGTIPTDKTALNIKAMFGFWTEQYLSALGQSSTGGGGGVTELAMLDDVSLSNVQAGQVLKARIVGNNVEWYNANENTGTVTSIKIGTDTYSPTAGVITLPDYPTDYYSSTASRTANTVLAAPDGAPGAALFRSLVANDIPSLPASKINTGTFDAALIPVATTTTVGGIIVGTTLAIANSVLNLANSGVTAGTYRSVTVDSYGRVTAGTNPTTLAGYGITDAGIGSGVITLGSDTITPVTDVFVGTGDNANKIGKTVGGSTTYFIVPFATNATNATNATYASTTADTTNTLYLVGVTSGATTTLKRDTLITMTGGALTMSGALKLSGSTAATRRIYFGDNEHYLELDANGFHFSHGVYSDGFVSALGLNSQGGGGVTFLSDLDDVVLNNVTAGQVLKARIENGSVVWYNDTDLNIGTVTSIKIGATSYSPVSGVVTLPDYPVVPTNISAFTNDAGYITTYTDTKNTTGGDDTSYKIYLVGMTAQTTNNGSSRTYTHDTAYVGEDGCLYSGGAKVLTSYTEQYTGTVTSIGMTVPTGFSVSPETITSSGTFAITFATGYSLPTSAKQQDWDAAASNATTLLSYFTNGVANEAARLSTVSKTLFGNTYWTDNGVPTSVGTSTASASLSYVNNITMSGVLKIGDIYIGYDQKNNAIEVYKLSGNTKVAANFYAYGGVSALGIGSSGGGGGIDYDAMWEALAGNTNEQINLSHLTTALGSYATRAWVTDNFNNYVLPTATTDALGGIMIGYEGTGKNYPVQLDANSKAFVNVPWEDTTYTLAGLMGSEAKGGLTQPIYWDGSKFANTTYTLGKSVPADAKFTDTTYKLTVNGTTNGDSVSGTNLGSLYAIATSDATLANQAWMRNANNTGYVWRQLGARAFDSTEYLKLSDTEQTVESTTSSYVKGVVEFYRSSGDYVSLISFANKDLDGNKRSLGAIGFNSGGVGRLIYLDTSRVSHTIWHEGNDGADSGLDADLLDGTHKSGLFTNLSRPQDTNNISVTIGGTTKTITLGSNAWNSTAFLPLTGGTLTGNLTTTNIIVPSGNTIKIGDAYLKWDNDNNAVKVYKLNGSTEVAVNLYATGGVSALGVSDSGSGGGVDMDVVWTALANNTNEQINATHLSTALTGYATQAWVQLQGYITSYTDTKNTAGSTNLVNTKLFIIGAQTQGANPQTYSYVNCFIGTDGCLYSNGTKVLTSHQSLDNYVKIDAGATEQTIKNSITTLNEGVINLWRSNGDYYTFLGFSNGTTKTYLGGIGFKSQSDHNLYRKDGQDYHKILDASNYTDFVNTTNFAGLDKTGTVTSIGMTVPTGFSVTPATITTNGTFAITYANGYSLPTTVKQTNWDTAYGWGNHADAGYLTGITATMVSNALGFTISGVAGTTYNLATIASNATSGKSAYDLLTQMFTLEGAGTTEDPYVIKANYGLYTQQFLSALGLNSQGGGGIDIDVMWTALATPTLDLSAEQIHVSHLNTALSGYATKQWVQNQGYITSYTNTARLQVSDTTNRRINTLESTGSYIQFTGGTNKFTVSDGTSAFDVDITPSVVFPVTSVAGNTGDVTATQIASALTTAGYELTDTTYSYGTAALLTAGTDTTERVWQAKILKDEMKKYLLLSGGEMSGTLTTNKIRINGLATSSNTNNGIYYYNGTYDYLLIGQGSQNLWIGANETIGRHHTGSTYISAGDGSIYASKLVDGSRNNYEMLDSNNWGSYVGTSSSPVGYATNATTATKLSTVNKYAWGQTYWTNGGVPDSISGNISNTGNITPTTNDTYSLGSSSLRYDKLYVKEIYIGGVQIKVENDAIHVVDKGFYADTFVSSLGLNSSGSSGGATVLSDLTDVEYSGTPSDGQVLKYSNGKWRNGTDLNIGTVTAIKLGATGTSYSPTDGVVTLPAYPTTLPASDVYSWAKASTKPSYTLDEVDDGTTRKLSNYLPLSGSSTMTGMLNLLASQYSDDYSTGALNLNNSNIQGVNAIYTANEANGAQEGIHFYRDTTHVDSLWIANGVIYFVPNRALGTNTTAANSYVVMTSNNWSTYIGTSTSPVAYAGSANYAASAGSATALTTARLLWGNSFDGTADINNDIKLPNNKSIRFARNMTTTPADSDYWNVLTLNASNQLALGYYNRTHNTETSIQGGTITLNVNGGRGSATSAVDNAVQAISILSDGQVYLPQGAKGLRIGNGLLVWDSANNAIKVISYDGSSAANFYATGAVSALGANTSGSGGGGSSTLAGLTDVSVGSQTQGQVLGWDGQSHWVPMNMPSTSNFVTLNSTQTITGQKTFTSAVTAQSLWSDSVWANGAFSVYDYTTDFAVLSSSGSHVGIGTAVDTNYTLKVGGNTKVNGSITLSGSSVLATLSVDLNSRLNVGSEIIAYISDIPSSISNYITTNTDQNNLGGAKTWTQNASGQAIVYGNVSTKIEYTGITFSAKALGVSGTSTYTLAADTTGLKIGSDYIIHSGNIGSQSVNYATSAGSATDSTKLPLAGGTMTGQLFISMNPFGDTPALKIGSGRYLYLTGNNITMDMSADGGTWAGSFMALKDSVSSKTALGFYGKKSEGLSYFYFGGTYNSPIAKLYPSSRFQIDSSGDIIPAIDSTYSLGTSSKKWANIYATTFNGNATSATYATSAGSATDSTKLPLTGGTITSNSVKVEYSNYNVDINNKRVHFGITSGSSEVIYANLTMEDSTTTGKVGRLKVGSEYLAYLSDITSGGSVDSVCGYTGDVTAADIGSALQGEGYELTDSNTARLRVGNVNNKTICTTENTDATIQFTGGTDGFTVTDGLKSFTVPVTTTGTTYSQGTGISISGTTISMSSTYRTYCSNGNTAYGWGNHANAGYLTSSSNAASATKLKTSRTLWGQSFNGTSNCDGTVTITQKDDLGTAVRLIGSTYTMDFRIGSGNVNRGIWNQTSGAWMMYFDASNTMLSYGKVGVGITTPSYKLHVDGAVGATAFTNTSDVRKKDIYDYNALVAVGTIANAPAVRFRWKEGEDKNLHCGSLAQYWNTVMPECVTQDDQGYLSMQYDIIALLAAISIAKKVVNHEQRIAELERENRELRQEINNLKAA